MNTGRTRLHPRQVEAFRSVMLTGSITLAAEMMFVTQPAVSRLVRDFEIAVALKLFDRDGRRLVPRAEAINLYREVERLYLGLDHIARAADHIRGFKGVRLRIASMPSLASSCVLPILSKILADRPEVSLVFHVESSDYIADLVTSHQYDLGFIFGPLRQGGLPVEPLATTKAVVAVQKGHPLSRLKRVGPRDIADYRLCLPGEKIAVRNTFDDIMASEGLEYFNVIETSMANSCALAALGEGVALSDPVSVGYPRGDLVTRPFLPAIDVAYVTVRPPQAPRSQLADEIIEKVRAAVESKISAVVGAS